MITVGAPGVFGITEIYLASVDAMDVSTLNFELEALGVGVLEVLDVSTLNVDSKEVVGTVVEVFMVFVASTLDVSVVTGVGI